jgi:hypothetical protein
MSNEFKKITQDNVTRYVLESDGGTTSSGSIASNDSAGFKKGALLTPEGNKKAEPPKPRNFVAKNAKMGGAGAHTDKKKAAKQGQEKHKKPYMEEFNGEYDDEAGMAHNGLHTIMRAVKGLESTIKQGDNLPEWCQEKLSLAEDYLVTVWDYLQSEQGVAEEKWIQKAVNPKTKGDLHTALHVSQGNTIPKSKIEKASHSKNSHLRHMAQFAKNVSENEYFESLTNKLAEKLDPNAPVDDWVQDFAQANPEKYHQFRQNNRPGTRKSEKKIERMAQAASYAAKTGK